MQNTVLIVDDTTANLSLVVNQLEDNGLRVVVAQDGEECLERAGFVRPDLILLDIMMPGINGFEACRRLKADAQLKDIPVIFMSALADTSDKLYGFEVGGVDYITKPFDIVEVLARVKTHIAARITQTQLIESRQRLHDIAESAADWFWETDAELRFTHFSDRFYGAMQIQPAQIIGRRYWETARTEDVARAPEKWRKHREDMEQQRPFRDFEYETSALDRTVHISVSGKPFYDVAEQFLGYRGTATDITELVRTRGRLLQADKMASIGKLAAGVAHEINNPVGFVKSNLGSLHRYIEGLLRLLTAYEKHDGIIPPAAHEQLQILKSEIDFDYLKTDLGKLLEESKDGLHRVQQIVGDLKDFSRAGDAQWGCADLHRCLDSTLNIVGNEIKYKAELIKDYGTLPPVECIPSQLNQVLMNLLVNAADAITEQGRITVRTGCDAVEAWVEISDTGCGIGAADLKRIFDPFYTTKPIGKGTGLGLSVSYDIVHKHGGRIEVESAPGQGTTFRMHLPIKRSQSAG